MENSKKRGRRKKFIPDFQTDAESLREYLTPRDSKPVSEPPLPEYAEIPNEFWVKIRKHVKTGATYLEKDDMKIWIFKLPNENPFVPHEVIERYDEESGYGTIPFLRVFQSWPKRMRLAIPPYATRMVSDLGIYSRGKESEIPEDQRGLFGYTEYAKFFPESGDSLNHAVDPGDDLHPTIKATIHVCISHKIPGRYVSDLVRILPPKLYKIARRMGTTFDYADKFAHRRKDSTYVRKSP